MEELIRTIADILKRLDHLEAQSRVTYTKGTYAPTYAGSATAGVTTYTAQDGFWTRIGNVIFFNGRITWTAATGTGNAQFSLPFASQNTTGMRYSGDARISGVTFANSTPEMRIEAGATIFTLDSPLTNAAVTIVAMEAAGDVIFSGWYRV